MASGARRSVGVGVGAVVDEATVRLTAASTGTGDTTRATDGAWDGVDAGFTEPFALGCIGDEGHVVPGACATRGDAAVGGCRRAAVESAVG